MDVRVNLTRRKKNTRKYVEMRTTRSKSSPREEATTPTGKRRPGSKENYKVRKMEYDTTGNRTFKLEGLTKLKKNFHMVRPESVI